MLLDRTHKFAAIACCAPQGFDTRAGRQDVAAVTLEDKILDMRECSTFKRLLEAGGHLTIGAKYVQGVDTR